MVDNQDDQQKSVTTNSQAETSHGENPLQDIERMISSLKESVTRFQAEQSPENLAVIVSALGAFGLSGTGWWSQAADYTKKNPLRAALFAGLAFFALKGLMPSGSATQRVSSGTMH